MIDDDVSILLASAQKQISQQTVQNQFLELLDAGEVPQERLGWLAGELYRLVYSDRRSFSLIAARFPTPPAGDLFLAMADGEGQALRLLLDFADALGIDEQLLAAYEPRPLAQAYPAYLTQTAMFGTRSDVALALLANVQQSGGYSARAADALSSRYGFDERAVAHFRFYANTPQALLDQARSTLQCGISEGDDPLAAVRTARMVHIYETTFWATLAEGINSNCGTPSARRCLPIENPAPPHLRNTPE